MKSGIKMNPLNTQQHPPTGAQYYIAGMPPLTSTTSILKSNVSATVSGATQQQPTIVTTLNSVGGTVKGLVTGNNLIDTTKYVTTSANYMPVLLTNQTLISNVDPIKHQQLQYPPKAVSSNILSVAPAVTGTNAVNTSIPLIGNKPVVLSSANSAPGNITYQVLSTSQNNNLTPVLTAPNGTVSVLLTSSQPIASTAHVGAPIIIRNTQTSATTAKAVQMKQQPQFSTKQQLQPKQHTMQLQQNTKLNTFNQQSFNTEILKQIVVGNPSSGTTPVLTPGTTLLKPQVLQSNKPILQQSHQPIQSKTVVKNTKMMITPPQQKQQMLQKHQNHTIITTTAENSSQMFAALGMELVKSSNVALTTQKMPQVSFLQTSLKKSSNVTEIINEPITVRNHPLEITVGNLNNEVSLIKKPSTEAKESSLLKCSKKMQPETLEDLKQDKSSNVKINTNDDDKELITEKETQESISILKSNHDLKNFVSECNNITNKSSNIPVEKQTSLLKPKICDTNITEASSADEVPQTKSPRSQRSKSDNTPYALPTTASITTNVRRNSGPPNINTVTTDEITIKTTVNDEYHKEAELGKSQELEIFFEEEEYLESSGAKSSASSEISHASNKNPKCSEEVKGNLVSEKKPTLFSKSKQHDDIEPNDSQAKDIKKKDMQEIENIETDTETKLSQDVNDEENSSDDDDVTILPVDEVEIEQIEIYDDDDDDNNAKNASETNSTPSSLEDKEQHNLNASLLCDEQFLISSSSSISNNSSDQNSVAPPLTKSPQIDNVITTPLLKKTLMEPKVFSKKEEPYSNGYLSVLDMLSNFNMLSWREKIGTARGTNLKFQLNEFNLIQLYEKNMPNKRIHTAYEKPIYERESSVKRNENCEPPTYYMCRRCHVQGPSIDFLAPEFCSLSCLKRDSRKRRDDTGNSIRKRNRLNNINNFAARIYSSNVNDTCNFNNPPQLTYFKKPKFRWNTYINENNNVRAAPISLFLNPFPTGPNNFSVGMKLEAIDPENCALFCVCTVISIMGYRLKLSFDGYSSAYDFWVNADSMDIFPPGWCAKTNHILQPPKGIAANKFNWGAYLNKEKALPAPRSLFTHLNSAEPNNPFKIGMHLEAEDLNDTGKLCVASVADVLDDRIRIHFDGWDDCYDIIVDISSPYIHPCGWHEGRQQLVVPPDFENTAFNWNDYIRMQGTGEIANEELFAPREPINFQPNMILEVVDPRNPSLIRPASVVLHKGHRVKLHLDGWPNDYCFWLEDDSPDLHPIGWCDATGHDLEPPPGFQILKQKMPCPVDGCRGIGNAKNPFKFYHATREGCPYAAENWRTVMEKPPRVEYDNIVKIMPSHLGRHSLAQQATSLQSRLSEQQILERLQMLDNIKTRNVLVQQDKLPTNHGDLLGPFSLQHLKHDDIKEETKLSKIINSTSTSSSTSYSQKKDSDKNSFNVNIEIAREYLYDYGPRLQQNFNVWQRNFSFDAEKIKRNPLTWSTTEVSVFVDLYLNCRQTATMFSHEDIDGQAFLLLQQQDLTENLGIKLGPAVKLYTCILQLRTLAVTKFCVPYKCFVAKK